MNNASEFSPVFRIALGTQVVLRRDHEARLHNEVTTKKAGSVGEVVEQPLTNEYPYLVRFVDSFTVRAVQHDLTVLRSLSPEQDVPNREIAAYEGHLILRVTLPLLFLCIKVTQC